MNNIQIEGVDSNFSQFVLEDLQYLKQHLDDVIVSSERTLIANLIEETEFLLEEATKDDSKTYRERHNIFAKLNKSWLDAWNHYKNTSALSLISLVERVTNYCTAYSHFFLSLTLMHECTSGKEKADFEGIASGYLLLSEVIDVFIEVFPISLLNYICDSAKNTISASARSITEYFNIDRESFHSTTQIKAYCSLIILKVEEYIKNAELSLETENTQLKNKIEVDRSPKPWWEQIAGTFADNPAYNEAMRLGREYRNSHYSEDTELTDV